MLITLTRYDRDDLLIIGILIIVMVCLRMAAGWWT